MPASDRPDVAQPQNSGGPDRGYTPLQMLYLLRLRNLIARRQQYVGRLESGNWRLKLLDKALYSTYRDCVDLSLTGEARNLLRQIRQAQVR